MGRIQIHQKDRNEAALVAYLEARGCRYVHLGRPVDGLLAVPTRDRWLSVPVEFKAKGGVLQPTQEQFLARWPAPTYVLRSEVECVAMLADLGAVRI